MIQFTLFLRQPGWTKSSNRNELFWGARGVVRDFIERVFSHALAPIKITRNEDVSLTGTNIKNEFLHLFLPDINALREVAGNLSPDVFFKMLESTLLSEIIAEVRVRVKVKNVEQALSFRELSEGEQQLLTVLGLLKFTGGRGFLFLLDEPDTHLNPAWDIKYLQYLRDFVSNKNTSHVIMISHNPLAIAELQKEQVQVMWRDEKSQVYVDEPGEDPQGMGFEGILMSDMFGLKSPLDPTTQKLLEDKLALLAKDKLTRKEEKNLTEIDAKLSSYDMNYSSRDPLYSIFLKKVSKKAGQIYIPRDIVLTKKQRKELDDITQSVIDEIKLRPPKGNEVIDVDFDSLQLDPQLQASLDEATNKLRQIFELEKKYKFIQANSNLWRSTLKSLAQLTNNTEDNCKCWYCECDGSEGFYFQVDHFRPKKRVKNKGAKKDEYEPGYWWLALSQKIIVLRAKNVTPALGNLINFQEQILQSER